MTEEQYEKALNHLEKCYWDQDNSYSAMNGVRKDLDILNKLIHEHFSNPPLKFEELKENMWVWDNKLKEWRKVIEKLIVGVSKASEFYEDIYVKGTKIIRFEYNRIYWKDIVLEPNRFYRKEVQE